VEGPLSRTLRLRELLVGVEGLALLRRLYEGTDAEAEARLSEIRTILDGAPYAAGETTREADVRRGYGVWAPRYDEPGNQVIAMEAPVVAALVAGAAPGRALDLACGTGRHGRLLQAAGHHVVGVDLTPEMLAVARDHFPVTEGDLGALPARSGAFDLAVCGLAVAHVADLAPVMAEIARILRPGGRAVISALHPFQAHLGWHAPFETPDGRGFVREYAHTHADYLRAFRAVGLDVLDCVEPVLGPADVEAKRRSYRHIPEATLAAYEGLPGVLVWSVQKAASGVLDDL
jgi:SAM-dependent methyltransferase